MSDNTAASADRGQGADPVDVGEDGNSATQSDQETAQLPEQSTQPEAETTDRGPTTTVEPEDRALESRWEMLVRRVLTKYWLEALVAVIALCFSCALAIFLCITYFPIIQPNCTLGIVGQWNQWSVCKCGDLNRTRKREVEVFDGDVDCVSNSQMQPCPTFTCSQCVMGECFGFDHRQMSWSQALREDNLASIHSHNQMIHLWARVNESTPKLWIGLRCFAHGTCEWSDGSDVDYWAIDGSQTQNQTVLCTYIDLNDRKWHFGSCDDRLPSVKNLWMGNANCSSLDQCYAISEDQQQWEKANDLVIIQNPQENIFVKSLLDSKNVAYWIGLHCSDGQRCMWWDKSGARYINGSLDSYNDSYCVLMDAEGGWEGRDCTETHKYISETQPHCNKIGQMYWSPWTKCYCGEERTRKRGPHSVCSKPIPKQIETQECSRQLCADCNQNEKFDWCYYVSDKRKSYQNIKDGDLVMIGSKRENDYIMKLLKEEQVTSPVLIGLGCESTQQLSYCQWYNGEHLNYNKFGLDQPLVKNESYTCVAIDVQRDEWMSVDCRNELRYVLEHKPVCNKFVNYSNIDYGSVTCTGGFIYPDIESHRNCPLISSQNKSDVCHEDCAPRYEGLEYCYKVMLEKKRPDIVQSNELTLAVLPDKRHARFINEQIVPRGFNNGVSNLKLWLGIYCEGEEWCYWNHNKVVFDPKRIHFPFNISIRTKNTHCGTLNWKSKTSQSFVEIDDCSVELPYVLEWAPGCDKFRQFESLEYICDKPGCGNIICAPEVATNCPPVLSFTGACCSGHTNHGLSACYQVENVPNVSNSAWQVYWKLQETKPNLADPFVPQVIEFWKSIVPKQSGFYLTSYFCFLFWPYWRDRGRGRLNIRHCQRWNESLASDVLKHASDQLKDSWSAKELGCPSSGEIVWAHRMNICTVDMLVIYNSMTERLELLENRNKIASGYIAQYAKESKEFSTHLCPSKKIHLDQDETKCPVQGRCCSGATGELVPACYEVINKPKTTYNSSKAQVENLADLGINDVEEGSQLAILVAVIDLWRQIIDRNSGRYWTNLRCYPTGAKQITDEDGAVKEADCTNHFQQEKLKIERNSYKAQNDAITFDHSCNGCCLVYDSALEALRTQECDSVEDISGYIVQYPKYARVNDWIGVSHCYDRLTWTNVKQFDTQLYYNHPDIKFCQHEQRCEPLLEAYGTPNFLL